MAKIVQQGGHGGSIDVTFEGDVGVIVMRRGQNRLNEQFMKQMNAAMDEVLRNPRTKAMVTTNEGRFYSNGVDLEWLAYLHETDPAFLERFDISKAVAKLTHRFLTFPLPTIALIKGHAFAGGAIMALAHDHVIMQRGHGWLCLNEVHIKRRFPQFLVAMLRAKLPAGQTLLEAAVLGRRYTAEEAKSAGVVHEMCKPQDMLSTALAWIKHTIPQNGFDREHLQFMKEDTYKNVTEQDLSGPNILNPKL